VADVGVGYLAWADWYGSIVRDAWRLTLASDLLFGTVNSRLEAV
jgi:hypothetical protein